MTVTATGASLTGWDRRDADSTTGRSSRKSDSVTAVLVCWVLAFLVLFFCVSVLLLYIVCGLLITAYRCAAHRLPIHPVYLCISRANGWPSYPPEIRTEYRRPCRQSHYWPDAARRLVLCCAAGCAGRLRVLPD